MQAQYINPCPQYFDPYPEPEDSPIYKFAAYMPALGTIVSSVCGFSLFLKAGFEDISPHHKCHIYKLLAEYSVAYTFSCAMMIVPTVILVAANVFPLIAGIFYIGIFSAGACVGFYCYIKSLDKCIEQKKLAVEERTNFMNNIQQQE